MYCTYAIFIFCFLMLRLPPRSTLFPYTTALPISFDLLVEFRDRQAALLVGRLLLRGPKDLRIDEDQRLLRLVLLGEVQGDRKSTRLNSSHPSISYAVFCLKKKKNKHNQNTNINST